MSSTQSNYVLFFFYTHTRESSFEEVSGFSVRSMTRSDLLTKLKVVIKHEHGAEEFIPLQVDTAKGLASAPHGASSVKLKNNLNHANSET